jgi:uncharacterized membrane protein YfcA
MTLLYCVLVLLLGGVLKGTIGLGLPQIGISLIALVFGLKEALAILVLPLVASNISQSYNRKLFLPVDRLIRSILVRLFFVSTLSVFLIGLVPERMLLLWLGIVVVIFSVATFFWREFRILPHQEIWAGPIVGAIAGIIGGLSTLSGPPLMLYLACLRLRKEEFVVAISQMFLIAYVGLALGILTFGFSRPTELVVSVAACIPVFIGMWLGNKARVRMSERAFAVAVFVAYFLTGVSFIAKAAWH